MNNFLAQERTHFIYKAQSVSCESVRSRTKVNILCALFKFFIYRLIINRIFNDLRGPFGKLEPGSVSKLKVGISPTMSEHFTILSRSLPPVLQHVA